MIQPAAPPGNSDKESEPVSQEEGGSVSQQENEAVSQQVNAVDGDTIQTKVCQALEKVKQLTEEASRHITRAKVMYKPMEGIFNIRSNGCKPKSWELNYPALAFLLNGGYYADYAGIMGMMGLPIRDKIYNFSYNGIYQKIPKILHLPSFYSDLPFSADSYLVKERKMQSGRRVVGVVPPCQVKAIKAGRPLGFIPTLHNICPYLVT